MPSVSLPSGGSVLISLSGLMVEPLAWFQSLLFDQHLRRVQLPDDPFVVIATGAMPQFICVSCWPGIPPWR